MKNCPYCGKALEDSIDQCPHCFANVSTDVPVDVDEKPKRATKKGEK